MPQEYCSSCVSHCPPRHQQKANLLPYLPIRRRVRRCYSQCGQTDVSSRYMAMSILVPACVPHSDKSSQKNLTSRWTTWRSFSAIRVKHPIKVQRLRAVRYNYTARRCDKRRRKQGVGYYSKLQSSWRFLNNTSAQKMARLFMNAPVTRPSDSPMQS